MKQVESCSLSEGYLETVARAHSLISSYPIDQEGVTAWKQELSRQKPGLTLRDRTESFLVATHAFSRFGLGDETPAHHIPTSLAVIHQLEQESGIGEEQLTIELWLEILAIAEEVECKRHGRKPNPQLMQLLETRKTILDLRQAA